MCLGWGNFSLLFILLLSLRVTEQATPAEPLTAVTSLPNLSLEKKPTLVGFCEQLLLLDLHCFHKTDYIRLLDFAVSNSLFDY